MSDPTGLDPIQLALFRRLRRANYWAPTTQLETKAKALAATGAFGVCADSTLGIFGEPHQIAAAKQIDPTFVRACGFSQELQPVPGETLMDRLDRRMRAMGEGSYEQAMNGDDDDGDFPGLPPRGGNEAA